MNATKSRLIFHLIAIVTVIIWGTTFVSTKILIQNGLTPSEIFFYRFVLAYICMWSISRKKFFANSIKDEFLLLLAGLCGGTIYFSFDDMVSALHKRHDFFAEQGCKLSDHGIEEFYAENYTDAEIKTIFNKVYSGQVLTKEEILKFKSAMLVILGEMDWEKGWTQQFHYGAIRNNNTKMFKLLGPDTGFDSIGEFTTAKAMAKFLDRLNMEGKLTKTILYNLNPCANEVIATMVGNFQDGTIPGKIQFGSGWWFLDQKDGMEKQINALSLLGLLSRFVGMLTDSRSFLSYPRHEYFRRTLCNLLGNDIENGEIPVCEMERVNQMVEDIAYNNAKKFFQF